MIEKSLARSSRHIRVTEEFIELLEADTGIRRFYLSAFLGCPSVPVKQAIRVTFWAHDSYPDDPDHAGAVLETPSGRTRRLVP